MEKQELKKLIDTEQRNRKDLEAWKAHVTYLQYEADRTARGMGVEEYEAFVLAELSKPGTEQHFRDRILHEIQVEKRASHLKQLKGYYGNDITSYIDFLWSCRNMPLTDDSPSPW